MKIYKPEEISPELILSLQTPKGGWTRSDLASIGVPWPPAKGWRKQLEDRWRRKHHSTQTV